MIKTILFENFKGQTGGQELTGKDIFIGHNGSGKSTRIQAIGLSMLGYVPGYGRTENDTMKLATGEKMAVGIAINDGFSFDRTFNRTEETNRKTGERTVKISQSIDVVPGRGESNETQRKARIAEEVGNFPVMLDFNEFLNLSDSKRRSFIYSLSPIASQTWTRDRVREYLEANLLSGELQENNPDQYQEMEKLIAEAMTKYPTGWNVSDGLQAMLDWAETQKKTWTAKTKDSQGAVRQLADLKNQLVETDRNIAAEKEEQEQLQQQLIKAEKQLSTDTEKKRQIDGRLSRIQELQRLISSLKDTTSQDVTGYDQQLQELNSQICTVDHTEQIQALTLKIGKLKKSDLALYQQMDALKQEISQLLAGASTLESSLKKIDGLGGTCLIDKRIACGKDFTKFKDFVEQTTAKANEQVTAKQDELQTVIESRQLIDLEIKEAERAIQEMVTAEREANIRNRTLNEEIARVTQCRNDVLNFEEKVANQIALYQEELDRLNNLPAEAIAPLDILEKQIEGLRLRIGQLKDSIEEKGKARQTILLLQQSKLENKTAELKAACLKSIVEALGAKGVQGELVKELLDPFRSDIHINLKLMGFNYEPFFQTESDTGKEIFQFGWINDHGHRCNFDALSTGQQTIFLAAMMMAVIDRAQPKLKVLIMDNINHLDRQNFKMFIDGLSQVSDKLDNIVIAGVVEFEFAAPGWKVWNLSPDSEQREAGANEAA